jgi:hypothetical protein
LTNRWKVRWLPKVRKRGQKLWLEDVDGGVVQFNQLSAAQSLQGAIDVYDAEAKRVGEHFLREWQQVPVSLDESDRPETTINLQQKMSDPFIGVLPSNADDLAQEAGFVVEQHAPGDLGEGVRHVAPRDRIAKRAHHANYGRRHCYCGTERNAVRTGREPEGVTRDQKAENLAPPVAKKANLGCPAGQEDPGAVQRFAFVKHFGVLGKQFGVGNAATDFGFISGREAAEAPKAPDG